MACVLFPNQRERKIAVSKVISLMESLTLQGANSASIHMDAFIFSYKIHYINFRIYVGITIENITVLSHHS